MFRQLSGVHSILIRRNTCPFPRGVASGSLCTAWVRMPKLERSQRCDLARDMNWSFNYFTGRGLSRGSEHAFSNPEDGTYMAGRNMQLYILWE